jgi:hypothetical protein
MGIAVKFINKFAFTFSGGEELMNSTKTRAIEKPFFSNDGTILQPSIGRSISMMGGTIAFKTENQETGGTWALLVLKVPPHFPEVRNS